MKIDPYDHSAPDKGISFINRIKLYMSQYTLHSEPTAARR